MKVQIWEEEVTEMSKELKNRELDRLREAAKAERERSGKQLSEQEQEIMRLKSLLHGEKSEWYRLMEQEKLKYVRLLLLLLVSLFIPTLRMKSDRSNELESLQREADTHREEKKTKERELNIEKRKIEQERTRYNEDRLLWKKEIEGIDEKIRQKDAEIAKIQVPNK